MDRGDSVSDGRWDLYHRQLAQWDQESEGLQGCATLYLDTSTVPRLLHGVPANARENGGAMILSVLPVPQDRPVR